MSPMNKKVLNFGVIGIGITLLLTLVGELFRLKGILLLDLWLPIFVGGYVAIKAIKHELIVPKPITYFALGFVLIGFASLFISSGKMSWAEVVDSAFYGTRWLSAFGLFVVAKNEIEDRSKILWMLLLFAFLLSVAGFIQLYFVPDFEPFEELGWDPHKNRLLSTWFDPNFVGGFLAFSFTLLLGLYKEKKKWRMYLAPLGAIIIAAVFFTYSRSAYLSLLVGVFFFGLLRSWKIIVVGTVLTVLLVAVSDRAQERVDGFVTSIKSVTQESHTFADPSSRHRFDSWREGYSLFLMEPFIGHGYNRYKYAANELGTLRDITIHSASGSDASLLNILATTGMVGFTFYVLTYASIFLPRAKIRSAYTIAFICALLGLFIHSVFVNSLLFPLIMAPFWLAAGLIKDEKR